MLLVSRLRDGTNLVPGLVVSQGPVGQGQGHEEGDGVIEVWLSHQLIHQVLGPMACSQYPRTKDVDGMQSC